MFHSYLKMALRIATLVLVVAAAIGVLSYITIPQVDFSPFAVAVSKGKALYDYYIGNSVWWGIALALLGVTFVAFPAFRLVLLAYGWIMKANEG